MKVLECITDTNIGGAGVLLVTRLKDTDRTKFQTGVVLPKESQLIERLTSLDFPIHPIDGSNDRSFSILAIPRYLSLFRREKPDLVHCHGSLSARIAAMLCGVPVRVYTRHCVYPLPNWQKNAIGKILIGKAQTLLSHGIIAVAHSAKENLLEMGVPAHRVSVIINGVSGLRSVSFEETQELRERLGIPKDAIVIGICARLEACKDHYTLFRAAEILIQKDSSYRFLIVGDGSLREELERYCEDHGLSPYIIFAGFQSDVAPYYSLMRINVNCSVGTETSSLALSEGMSIGLPSVVSDYGGNPYMVRQGENGLVYAKGRAEGLAEAIEKLAKDPVLWNQLSKGAKERFHTELNSKAMTQKTEKLYEELFRQHMKKLNSK